MARPRRHVLEELRCESIVDGAAGFALCVAGFGDAAVRVVAGVGELFVGEDAAGCGEEEGEGEELHFGGWGGVCCWAFW